MLYDTSPLTSGATISSAIISLYKISVSDSNNDGKDYVNIYSSNPASNTDLVGDDFNDVGTTAFSSPIDLGSIEATYNDFTLNASGLSAISKTGISKFSVREGHDVENTTIGGGGQNNNFSFYGSNTAGKEPKLVVTYTVAAGPNNLKTYNTNLKANIKTINTNPIANVKTLNTNV